jgi:hypothetical protein
MKTHEFATALSTLARLLLNAPNQTLEEFATTGRSRRTIDSASVPVALSTLVALSEIDKRQWLELIREHSFPIDVRPRDASRDIMGKLLKYLEQNREARDRLTRAVQKSRSDTSPELMRAFKILLDEK